MPISQEAIRANGGHVIRHIPQPPRCQTRHPNNDVQCLGDYAECTEPAAIEVKYQNPETGEWMTTLYCTHDARKHGWM